ncbi:hypothetical protein GCM10023187_46260 [Nibrella viscosa]|uniref:Uncharacterized protein n=1 Tax=Nibrella viscosa TaxID=1084524 RepID=A0ABP8KTA4_9BACT
MKLEEEIALCQFGQGVLPADDLLGRLHRLQEEEKRDLFYELYLVVIQTKQDAGAVEQAIADCSLAGTDPFCMLLKNRWSEPDFRWETIVPELPDELPEGSYDKPYLLLLHLFKAYYQRRHAMHLEAPDNWRHWDLSKPEIVENLLTTHQLLVEDIYHNPDLQDDLLRLAKLEHEKKKAMQPILGNPVPVTQTTYDFVTYDDVMTESAKVFTLASWASIARYHLTESLLQALSAQYGLTIDKAIPILKEVVERHITASKDDCL